MAWDDFIFAAEASKMRFQEPYQVADFIHLLNQDVLQYQDKSSHAPIGQQIQRDFGMSDDVRTTLRLLGDGTRGLTWGLIDDALADLEWVLRTRWRNFVGNSMAITVWDRSLQDDQVLFQLVVDETPETVGVLQAPGFLQLRGRIHPTLTLPRAAAEGALQEMAEQIRKDMNVPTAEGPVPCPLTEETSTRGIHFVLNLAHNDRKDWPTFHWHDVRDMILYFLRYYQKLGRAEVAYIEVYAPGRDELLGTMSFQDRRWWWPTEFPGLDNDESANTTLSSTSNSSSSGVPSPLGNVNDTLSDGSKPKKLMEAF